MHRTRAADGGEAAAAAAVAEKVAPLLQLKRAAEHASDLGRLARAIELYERAVAAAEETLPRDSLITAACLDEAKRMRIEQALATVHCGNNPMTCDVLKAAWSFDERIQVLSQRCLSLCHDRFRAGTLFTPTPEEVAYFAGDTMPTALQGAVMFWQCATDAAIFRPSTHACAESETHLHAIYGALRAALEVVSCGMLHGGGAAPAGAQTTSDPFARAAVFRGHLVRVALRDDGAGGLLQQLRSTCGMSTAEEAALRRMVDWNQALDATPSASRLLASLAEQQQRADADVARHGLRACALPECAQTEPQPKTFKVCGRCRGVVYCSAVHQQQDWRRHKRTDGCAAAAAAGQ
jgi:hypothetical protein